MELKHIDRGNPFDWGKTSADYAKYRDIYPEEFYNRIVSRGLCCEKQAVLDIGTGTGVLPRNMYKYGGVWTGTDISENQIKQARLLAEKEGMKIDFLTCPAEEISFPDKSFDVVTACQCIWYPDHKILAPKLSKVLKEKGKFLILYMAWLPFEDKIAGISEEIILKYNPSWSGAGETRKPMYVPEEYLSYFDITYREEYDIMVHFTGESWHGRMRACRGVGASLSEEKLKAIPHKDRLTALRTPCLHLFRHLAQISIDRRQPACTQFAQSDEKSDFAIRTQSLCGIALKYGKRNILKCLCKMQIRNLTYCILFQWQS